MRKIYLLNRSEYEKQNMLKIFVSETEITFIYNRFVSSRSSLGLPFRTRKRIQHLLSYKLMTDKKLK